MNKDGFDVPSHGRPLNGHQKHLNRLIAKTCGSCGWLPCTVDCFCEPCKNKEYLNKILPQIKSKEI